MVVSLTTCVAWWRGAKESRSSPRGGRSGRPRDVHLEPARRAAATRLGAGPEPRRGLTPAAAARRRVGDPRARTRDPDRALRPGGVRGRTAAVLLTLRIRAGRRPRFSETVIAYPRHRIPGATASVVRALDERNACLLGDLLATRRRRASRDVGSRGVARVTCGASSDGAHERVVVGLSSTEAALSSFAAVSIRRSSSAPRRAASDAAQGPRATDDRSGGVGVVLQNALVIDSTRWDSGAAAQRWTSLLILGGVGRPGGSRLVECVLSRRLPPLPRVARGGALLCDPSPETRTDERSKRRTASLWRLWPAFTGQLSTRPSPHLSESESTERDMISASVRSDNPVDALDEIQLFRCGSSRSR